MKKNENKLPSPRLQLRWEKDGKDWTKRLCHYEMVIPLGEYDQRREDGNGEYVKDEICVEISVTKVSGGGGCPIFPDGSINLPFRDGAHAQWDSAALGDMPIYAICGEKSMKVEVRK